jgi:hypothetical protein
MEFYLRNFHYWVGFRLLKFQCYLMCSLFSQYSVDSWFKLTSAMLSILVESHFGARVVGMAKVLIKAKLILRVARWYRPKKSCGLFTHVKIID